MSIIRLALAVALVAHASAYSAVGSRSALRRSRVAAPIARSPESACTVLMATKAGVKAFVVGVAADSGCGKSTFMRRLTNIFGGKTQLLDIGRETNTLVSDKTTVVCLDDYHLYDRKGRSANKITALHKDCQNWALMQEHVRAGSAAPGSALQPSRLFASLICAPAGPAEFAAMWPVRAGAARVSASQLRRGRQECVACGWAQDGVARAGEHGAAAHYVPAAFRSPDLNPF